MECSKYGIGSCRKGKNLVGLFIVVHYIYIKSLGRWIVYLLKIRRQKLKLFKLLSREEGIAYKGAYVHILVNGVCYAVYCNNLLKFLYAR
jgi:hypothetical protein